MCLFHINDLALLNKASLKGTAYIEFSKTGKCHNQKDSKYLIEEVYEIFDDIFQKNCYTFDYFGKSKYSNRILLRIIKELKRRIGQIYLVKDIRELVMLNSENRNCELLIADYEEFLNNEKNFDFEELKKRLVEVLNDMIKYIKLIKKSGSNLWILGL